MPQVVEELITAEVVIADLTGRNPNVFYELGVRHSISSNTILIAQDLGDVPFDVHAQRIVVYSYDAEGLLKLQTALEQAILEILADPDRIDNPVRRILCDRQIQRLSKEHAPPGSDALQSLIGEVTSLRRGMAEQLGQIRSVLSSVTARGVREGPESRKGTGNDCTFFERTPPPAAPPAQMPRYRRIVVADCAHHVTQRGNQRSTVFDTDDDRAVYLRLIAQNARDTGLTILGYALMPNHVH